MTSKGLLETLTIEGKLKRQKPDTGSVSDLLAAALRNFEAAQLVKNDVEEAAFKLAYDGVLQISRTVLLLRGYRPDDGEQHKTTFAAAGEILGPEFSDLIGRIQKYRIKRNLCLYDPRGFIGKSEAESLCRTAMDFWQKVRSRLEQEAPQLALFNKEGRK